MFFDNFEKLCRRHDISVYKACVEIGLNRSVVAKWKKGAVPNGATLQKIAGHFDVTVASLLGEVSEEKNKLNTVEGVELSEKELYYIQKIRNLTPEQQQMVDALLTGLEQGGQ